MQNNEYAYRILLVFDEDVMGVSENLKEAFTVTSKQLDYVGGPLIDVTHEIETVKVPDPDIEICPIELTAGQLDRTVMFNGGITLSPLGGV